MKAIIAQAGAYYGMSVVLVDDETAEKLVQKMQDRLVEPVDGAWAMLDFEQDQTFDTGVSIIICDVKDQKFGFDTGHMVNGFELIKKLLA